jgi:hypothetical protein
MKIIVKTKHQIRDNFILRSYASFPVTEDTTEKVSKHIQSYLREYLGKGLHNLSIIVEELI